MSPFWDCEGLNDTDVTSELWGTCGFKRKDQASNGIRHGELLKRRGEDCDRGATGPAMHGEARRDDRFSLGKIGCAGKRKRGRVVAAVRAQPPQGVRGVKQQEGDAHHLSVTLRDRVVRGCAGEEKQAQRFGEA